jgi:hypothetical protein
MPLPPLREIFLFVVVAVVPFVALVVVMFKLLRRRPVKPRGFDVLPPSDKRG